MVDLRAYRYTLLGLYRYKLYRAYIDTNYIGPVDLNYLICISLCKLALARHNNETSFIEGFREAVQWTIVCCTDSR